MCISSISFRDLKYQSINIFLRAYDILLTVLEMTMNAQSRVSERYKVS